MAESVIVAAESVIASWRSTQSNTMHLARPKLTSSTLVRCQKANETGVQPWFERWVWRWLMVEHHCVRHSLNPVWRWKPINRILQQKARRQIWSKRQDAKKRIQKLFVDHKIIMTKKVRSNAPTSNVNHDWTLPITRIEIRWRSGIDVHSKRFSNRLAFNLRANEILALCWRLALR